VQSKGEVNGEAANVPEVLRLQVPVLQHRAQEAVALLSGVRQHKVANRAAKETARLK
jgi:hypothetical protein